ncbi:histone-lysine N-methyltransferase 2C-like isoform X7 [Xiphophorus maculatus]|uniref:histone-lysine N-methyltransferase 2C-like isoform X7 n=1 Tax=Xiphophorus maculatus TaxID=8083 RepID=UPI000C6CDEC0|nr:histone-lysine N-methyltransferase 2C-like isoform X7 [Xiphophorus maculatus]
MPSEAQEPRDRGPPHPLTRAGRSAQLAKAAVTSPAPEKRPRGRPRKDGNHGRPAPPAPPSPKSKKGRSRGRAQVEGEESTGTTEKRRFQKKTEPKEPPEAKGPQEAMEPLEPPEPKGPQEAKEPPEAKEPNQLLEPKESLKPPEPKGLRKTKDLVEPPEPKEPPEAKGPPEPKEPKGPKKLVGSRRFISRHKSHKNPEPDLEMSQVGLSPSPEPAPEPRVPKCSSKPAPVSEEEDSTKTGPFTVDLLSQVPVEDPQVGAPEPGEPTHSPTPIETSCPSRVSMDTKEGCIVGPVQQNQELSPHSSPPVSLCLEDEDEGSLSPLFQHSPSEESGGSPAPTLGHAKKRLKQCAFCYRGDQPPLGQGRLVVFGPTPGYIPLHILNRRTSSDRVDDCHDHCYHGDRAPPTCSSPAQCEDESSSEFMRQLGPIGLPHDINVQSLFDPTGQCCAHLQCAAWSEGVRHGDGQSLLFVDKAIDSGSSQVCGFCQCLGASLRCQETGCGRSYHFPCAAAAGAHQDWTRRLTLCPTHAGPGYSRCLSCLGGTEPGNLLMCCCCGSCYHGNCLEPALTLSPLVRSGWQCPACRVCRSCRLRGDEGLLLVCQRCDKAYHTHCLSPPLDGTPNSAWTCKNCRVCRRCGVTSSGQWANHQFLCESCDPALPCPLCYRAVDFASLQDSLACSSCYRSVHAECSGQAGERTAESDLYLCSSCSPFEQQLAPPSDTSLALSPPAAPDTGQLFCLELPPSPLQSPNLELQPSPTPSSGDHPISSVASESILGTSQKDLQLTPPRSKSYRKTGVAASLEVLERSPSPPTGYQRHTSTPEQTDLPSSLNLAKYEPPVISPSTFCQSLEHAAAEPQQSHASPPAGPQRSPASPPAEPQRSPASPPAQPDWGPASPPAEPRRSPASPPAEPRRSPASPPAQPDWGPASPPAEPRRSPASPPAQPQRGPASPPAQPQRSPASPPAQPQRSPASPPAEPRRSPASPPAQPRRSPASPPAEPRRSPASPPAEPRRSPASPPAQPDWGPASPPAQPQRGPASPPAEPQRSPASPPAQPQRSPASPPAEPQRSPASPPAQPQRSPASPPAEPQRSPASPPAQPQRSPASPPAEPQRSPASPPAQPQRSPASPPAEPRRSPASPPAEPRRSPASPPAEPRQSPASPPAEPRRSPASPPAQPDWGPASPPAEPRRSPASPPAQPRRGPASPPAEPRRSPASPPAQPDWGPASPPAQPQRSPASPPAEPQRSPASPPAEPQRSPASPPAEPQRSPASPPAQPQWSPASPPAEPQRSPASPPAEPQRSPASPTTQPDRGPATETYRVFVETLSTASPTSETHQSPSTPPEETHMIPTMPTSETHQIPARNPAETHEILVETQSPASPSSETHESPSTAPATTHESILRTLAETHQSPSSAPSTKTHQDSVSPPVVHQSSEGTYQSSAALPAGISQLLPEEAEVSGEFSLKTAQSPSSTTEEPLKNHVIENSNIVLNHLPFTLCQSPSAPQEEAHRSVAVPADDFPQTSTKLPASILEDSHPNLGPSPEHSHQSPLCLVQDPDRNDASSLAETHKSLLPSLKKTQPHRNLVPSADEKVAGQVQGPSLKEIRSPSPQTTHQSLLLSSDQLIPPMSPLKSQQPSVESPGEKYETPAPSPEGTYQSGPPPSHMCISPEPLLKSSARSHGETCQFQEPPLKNSDEGLVPYPEADLQSLVTSPKNLKQDHPPSLERTEDCPELNLVNFSEVAALLPKEIHPSSAELPHCQESSDRDHQDSFRLAHCMSSSTLSHPASIDQQSPSSSPHCQSENQERALSHQLEPERLPQSQASPTGFEFGPVSSRPSPTKRSPVKVLQSSSKLSLNSPSSEPDFTEDQLGTRSLQAHLGNNPQPQSLSTSGLSPTRLQQGYHLEPEALLQRPCSPTSIMNSQPNHKLEAGISYPQTPTTLDHTTTGSDLSQNLCNLNPKSPQIFGSTKMALGSYSAPCSPHPLLGKSRPHSSSQPASPTQHHYNKMVRQSIDSGGLKLEGIEFTHDSSTVQSAENYRPHIPALQMPESLDNSSTSFEHSSLTYSPCVKDTKVNQSPYKSLSPCTSDSSKQAEPVPTMPTNPAFCLKVLPIETDPTPQSASLIPAKSSTQQNGPESPSLIEAQLAQPGDSISGQGKDIELHPDRLVHTEALIDFGPTQVHSSAMTSSTHTLSANSSVANSLTSIPTSDVSPRTSHAGQTNTVCIVQTPVSPIQSPALDGTVLHRPMSNPGTSPSLRQTPYSPGSLSDWVREVDLSIQISTVPPYSVLDVGAVQTAETNEGSQRPSDPARSTQSLASPSGSVHPQVSPPSVVLTSTLQAPVSFVRTSQECSVLGAVGSESPHACPIPGPVQLKPSSDRSTIDSLPPESGSDFGPGPKQQQFSLDPCNHVQSVACSENHHNLDCAGSGVDFSLIPERPSSVHGHGPAGAEQRSAEEEQGEAALESPEDEVNPAEMTEVQGDDEESSPTLGPVCPSVSLSSCPCSQATSSRGDHPPLAERRNVEEKYSQSQSLNKLVVMATESTKDGHQSHSEPSEKQEIRSVERHQPIRDEEAGPDEETSDGPILDLDQSLDIEVMELMTSAAPPASRRGKWRSLRPLPSWSRPSDDLSIRLRQSPFSTEASPETSPARTPVTPPPLTPPTPPSSRETPPPTQAPPTAVFLLTPKIGMGKPAISKRKFSPGRARSRQVPQVRSDQQPRSEACGASEPLVGDPEPRPSGRSLLSIGPEPPPRRAGACSLLGRSLLPVRPLARRAGASDLGSWCSSRRAPSPPSSSQDSTGEGGWSPKPRPPDSSLWSMKVGRGSGFPGRKRSRGGAAGGGRGGRGRSRLKAQDSLTVLPGGSYVETFQAKEEEENSMHNTVVMFSTSDHFTLKQDMCVVCGSFGRGSEGRLLPCSQCGQCYHPYCVGVKITRVVLTKGWRCLECTVCEACGDACDPARLLLCDDCDISYHTYCLDPPLLTVPKGSWKCKWCVWCVLCGSTSPGLRCDWLNNYSLCGPCGSLSQCPVCQRRYAQDDLVMQCQQCDRWVHGVCQGLASEEEVALAADEGFDCSLCRASSGRVEPLGSFMTQMVSRTREVDVKTYTQDGVCLTESGLTHLQALVQPLASPRKCRRCKPKLKLRIINQNIVSVLQTPLDPETLTEPDQNRAVSAGDLDCDMKSDSSPERDAAHLDDVTKETDVTDDSKKRKRKPYRPGIGGFMVRQRGGKAGLCRKDSSEMNPSRDPGMLETDASMEMMSAAEQAMEKVKKRYRKKKTKLEEAFPSYLQEAFFGRDLLDRGRQIDGRPRTVISGASQSGSALNVPKASPLRAPGPVSSVQAPGTVATSRKQGVLPGLDITTAAGDPPLSSDTPGGCGRCQRMEREEPLDAILSPELDQMVTDGGILSRLYKIPELEGKDVEEVFTAVLSPNSSSQPEPSKTHGSAACSRLPVMNGLVATVPPLPNAPSGGSHMLGFSLPSEGPAPSSASANRPSAVEGEQDVMSTAQRGTLKWEKEESLGELATVAPVLYCNTNFPQLKQQYPDWSTRVKQITKLWRKASSQDRAPFVQKARDNRAAQRINKAQLSNESLQHLQPPPLPPPPQGVYDPIAMETEAGCRDPLRPRESEQEQEWKLRQMMRQKSKQLAKMEATQKLEQVKNEQRQQQLRQSGRLSPEGSAHQQVAGGNATQSRQNLPQDVGTLDDVFLRPQVPAPSGFSSLPHSPLASSPLHQPPSSPQMFSPPSSRPSSPWDPYGKVAGPRLPQRLGFLSVSPAHDGSPALSPDLSASGFPPSRAGMVTPSSGSPPDQSLRPVRVGDSSQRTSLTMQGGVFKAPMPPHQEATGRRDPGFPNSPVSGLGSPHRSPYASGTPQLGDTPSSRPSPDPFRDPQTPGTPHPHSDCGYLAMPTGLRADPVSQPSPSSLDSYPSNPGTPRSSERFPRSPGSQRSVDLFPQSVGTPRPPPELHLQQPSAPRAQKTLAESLTAPPPASASSPLGPGLMAEMGAPKPQRSPGSRQESLPRTCSSQTPKHPVTPEMGVVHATGQDALEKGLITTGMSPMEKSGTGDLSSLDGGRSMLPQLGDSEEKLQQRLWLRQHILRQQHQKIALRQEKGLLEPTSGPAASSGTLHSWSAEDSSSAPPPDPFERPPPPYPGTVRPLTPRFTGCLPGEEMSGFPPSEASLPRQNLLRGPAVRFGVPHGALQDPSARPSLGPAVGLCSMEGNLVQMRRPVPAEFTSIRSLMPHNSATHIVPGVPQLIVQRPPPPQQHGVMPYIELRHRPPENRLKLPFPPPTPSELQEATPTRDPSQSTAPRPGPVKMGEGGLGQQHLGSALPGSEGIEAHLEGEDSAVKDLEDVEVKDLVDLNLNLDPEDGKDLDLGSNDLHLDDFLLTGKFDLIAYADPELNLEDKKDMFNEELDLGEPVEDREGSRPTRKMESPAHFLGQPKQELKESQKTEGHSSDRPQGAHSALLIKEKLEDSGLVSCPVPAQALSSVHPLITPGESSVFHQRPFGSAPIPQPIPSGPGPQGAPTLPQSPSTQPRLLLNPQNHPPHPGTETQSMSSVSFPENQVSLQNQNKSRPLLLEEQPLLLQELLDQERQEQQQQKQMQALIQHKSDSESGISDMDFESISDPIMKAKMQALKGINRVMSQGPLGLNPMVINRFQQSPGAPGPELTPPTPHLPEQDGKLTPQLVRRNPPSFGPGFINESQRQQYEEWLGETQQLLQMQQRLLEDQIAAHRKAKKALSAKQRTAKRAGRAFAEEDAAQLQYISEQQGAVQKQLEQIRKQQKDHTELIEDYRTKQPQRMLQMPPQMPLGQVLVPPTPRLGGAAPGHRPNVPSGWTPGSGPPMGQRVLPQLPAHMPPNLPNCPRAPPLIQTTLPMKPVLTAPTPGLTNPQGSLGGSLGGANGAPGDGATPQVKFDDNNPFSEGFLERERRERLREQQERQRVQLMQEVERQRALKWSLDQQDLCGSGAAGAPGKRGPVPGGGAGLVSSEDHLSQGAFCSAEPGLGFLPSSLASRHQVQGRTGGADLHQGFPGGSLPLRAAPTAALHPDVAAERGSLQFRPRMSGLLRPAGISPHLLGHDSSSSSPLTPHPHSSSGGLASLADIIPDDKPKNRRLNRVEEGARTPLSPHSDITAPPTPAVSDKSCSTPTHQPDTAFSGLASSPDIERQQRGSVVEGHRGPVSGGSLEVKEELMEARPCRGIPVKLEEAGEECFSSPASHGGDGGKELLRHLLRDKTSPITMTTPSRPAAHRQLSNDGVRSEEEDEPGFHGNMVPLGDAPKKIKRTKRLSLPDKDRAPSKSKRRRKEDDEEKSSSSDSLMTQLSQLSVLPLMEPILGVDLSLFPPYGSSSIGRDSLLRGSFGNASLDGVSDFYSQLVYKNNLSNPPTPPASLPPTPPPVSRQKMVNGFATMEELTRKELSEQEDLPTLKHKEDELLNLTHSSKTVDVPASLPTPPHNNQEELRVQESLECHSPEGFVPSSSPESMVDMEVSRYPDLSFIKLEQPSPCPSPTLPIIPCTWGKGFSVKQEVKTEPQLQVQSTCSSTDLVTIAITLNPAASQNVPGVMAAVAALLRVPGPINYQLSRAPTLERSNLALLAGVRVPMSQGSAASRLQRAPPAARNSPRCCSRCKRLLVNGVHYRQDGESRDGPSLVFCSPTCSALFESEQQNRSARPKPAVPVLLDGSGSTPPLSRTQHQYANNMSSIAVHSLPRTDSSSCSTSSSSPPLAFPPASAITMETRPHPDSLKVMVKLKPRPRTVSGDDSLCPQDLKKMKISRWRRWSFSITLNRGSRVANKAGAIPTEEEVDELLKEFGACLRPDPLPRDQRRCCFCHQQGDGLTDGPARLLNLDLDLWVHLNCALWSSEVYETQAGALINVELALRRGLALRCAHCSRCGATTGCNRLRCTNTYHFTCALQAHCTFFKDKTMLCYLHKPRTLLVSGDRSSSSSPFSTPGLPSDPTPGSDPYDSELRCFAVFRRVFVQRDEARQIAAVVQRGERQHTFRVGSLLFRAVGRLLPQQMDAFHNEAAIFPVGYHANRFYWSMRYSNRRCKYLCYIEEHEARPLFKVKVVEKGHDDVVLTGATPTAAWAQVLEAVARMRSCSGTLKLFPVYLKGEELFGLKTSAVTRIIESLPGVEACERYTFRYGRNPLMEWPLAFNPSGSARSEPKACQAKRPYLLTSVAPRCQGSVGSIVGLVPGVLSLSPGESVAAAHQGRHSKSAQYRRMKAEWKSNVYLARSGIQGLGLYAARDIEKCTMVIEYIGTIIRSEVANRKERLYEAQNRGVYMFRIDNDYVIDATITGGPARYINHSCAPNCITEVVMVEKENKIIISSCRRIQRGEELCYDYKFDLEDDQHKIPCHCGAMNCRKWMN